jgi:hypothetical protein
MDSLWHRSHRRTGCFSISGAVHTILTLHFVVAHVPNLITLPRCHFRVIHYTTKAVPIKQSVTQVLHHPRVDVFTYKACDEVLGRPQQVELHQAMKCFLSSLDSSLNFLTQLEAGNTPVC